MVDQTQDNRAGSGGHSPGWTVPGPDRTSVRRAILAIATPMIIAELVGLLALVGVFALMGRMGQEAVYVRSFYMPVASLFLAVFLAFGISNQIAAAVSRGRGADKDVLPVAAGFARLWLMFGGALIVLALVGAPWLADGFGVPEHARGDFIAFVRWMSVAELTMFGAVLASSSLRGYGKPGQGALVMLVASVSQIGGVAVIGLGLDMGPLSVPLATVIGAVAAAVVGVVMLRGAGLWTGGLGPWRPESLAFLRKVGMPIAATQLILFGANSALVAVLSGLGPDPVAGFSSAGTLQFLILMPGIVLGSATAIVINQQRGAGRNDWLAGTLRTGLEISVVGYLVIALAVWLGSDLLGKLMTDVPVISSEVGLYLGIIGLTYVFNGPVLTALTIMEQIGSGLVAVVLNFAYFAAIVVIGALVLRTTPESSALYTTIAWCNVAGVSLVAAAVFAVRKAAATQPMLGH